MGLQNIIRSGWRRLLIFKNKYNTNQDRKLRMIISWALVISWMAVIFMLSSQVAEQSNELSTGITQTVIEIIQKATPLWDIGSDPPRPSHTPQSAQGYPASRCSASGN